MEILPANRIPSPRTDLSLLPYRGAGRTPAQLRRVADLIAAAQAGDSAAWHALYEEYSPGVLKFIRNRLRGPEAEDLAADVWVRAMKNVAGHYEFRGQDFAAWLFTIARNLIVDHFKSARVNRITAYEPEMLTGLVDNGVTKPADRAVHRGPADVTLSYLDGRALWAAVARLTPEQRRCIELRFGCGLSVAETAEEIGCNEGAVKALQYRATRALARQLEPAGIR